MKNNADLTNLTGGRANQIVAALSFSAQSLRAVKSEPLERFIATAAFARFAASYFAGKFEGAQSSAACCTRLGRGTPANARTRSSQSNLLSKPDWIWNVDLHCTPVNLR